MAVLRGSTQSKRRAPGLLSFLFILCNVDARTVECNKPQAIFAASLAEGKWH